MHRMIPTIAYRLRPFLHTPGGVCLIPWTTVRLEAFPALLRFLDLSSGDSWEFKTGWRGPVAPFTVQLDLECRQVVIFGQTQEGFRRLVITRSDTGMMIKGERSSISLSLPISSLMTPKERIERVSFGSHTQLDWELVRRRNSLEEILPVLFCLGQCVPDATAKTPILDLLQREDQPIAERLDRFLKAGFHGILAPRLMDDAWQGIVEEREVEGSPLALLSEGYRRVRGLLFQEVDGGYQILPHVPAVLHAGRLVDLQTSLEDRLSIEWSSKRLRRLALRPAATRPLSLHLPPEIGSYRINGRLRRPAGEPVEVYAGSRVVLDRFEKN